MTFLNQVISKVSPEWALRREVAQTRLNALNSWNTGSGYGNHGASYARKSLLGWLTGGKSADEDIVDNIDTLRARSRDLFMGSPIATAAVKAIRTNVVGSGLMLNAKIDFDYLGLTPEQARVIERNIEREWELWAESVDCDAERRLNFYQLEALAILSAILSGDVFVAMPMIRRAGSVYDLRIGLIEADRICNPVNPPPPGNANILGGVEIGQYGETLAYWIAKNNPNAAPRGNANWQNEWKRVPAFGQRTGRRNILHLMADVERPAQRRGVPMLAPVIESLKQLDRYTEAELMAAVIAGMFTVFVTSNTPDNPLSSAFASNQVDKDPNSYELGNGAILGLKPGENITTANPGRPIAGYHDFVVAITQQIGAALEMPCEVLLKQFTASYSASRGALLEAWKMFRMRRDWIAGGFCQPIYEEWLTEAVLKGRIEAPGFFEDPAIRKAWCGAEWYGDCQGQLDPLKEANAAKVRVEEGFSTRSREAAEFTGGKWEDIHATRKREEEMRRADGLTPWAAQPAPVPVKNGDDDDE